MEREEIGYWMRKLSEKVLQFSANCINFVKCGVMQTLIVVQLWLWCKSINTLPQERVVRDYLSPTQPYQHNALIYSKIN